MLLGAGITRTWPFSMSSEVIPSLQAFESFNFVLNIHPENQFVKNLSLSGDFFGFWFLLFTSYRLIKLMSLHDIVLVHFVFIGICLLASFLNNPFVSVNFGKLSPLCW